MNSSLAVFAVMFTNATRSRLMLRFYASFMAFYISRTRSDVLTTLHQRHAEPSYERTASNNAMYECYTDAHNVLASLEELSCHQFALSYLPVGTICANCASHPWPVGLM